MYLKNAPVYFTFGDERRAVYHTVVADELTALGWTIEKTDSPTARKDTSELEPEPQPESELPSMEMTKNELIQYASERNVTLAPNSTKAEILTACLESLND